jgi:hypothetical protein
MGLNYRESDLPAGYKLRAEIEGTAAGAFRDDPHQRTLVLTRGWAQSDTHFPLLVHLSHAEAGPLIGTEGRDGEQMDLGAEHGDAVYHDGIWMPGPGRDQVSDAGVVVHWNRHDVHSVTVRTMTRTIGIRGTRRRGVLTEDLRRLARALAAG